MEFLLNKDFGHLIRTQIRTIINQSESYTEDEAEATALETVKGYLRGTYDLALIFIYIPAFDNAVTYVTDEYVYDDTTKKIYQALIDDPGNDFTVSAEWKSTEPRNKKIVEVVCDIMIYDMHTHVTPGNIPDIRVKRYDDAIKWLNKVQRGEISPGLPLVEGEISGAFGLGSNDKVSERW